MKWPWTKRDKTFAQQNAESMMNIPRSITERLPGDWLTALLVRAEEGEDVRAYHTGRCWYVWDVSERIFIGEE